MSNSRGSPRGRGGSPLSTHGGSPLSPNAEAPETSTSTSSSDIERPGSSASRICADGDWFCDWMSSLEVEYNLLDSTTHPEFDELLAPFPTTLPLKDRPSDDVVAENPDFFDAIDFTYSGLVNEGFDFGKNCLPPFTKARIHAPDTPCWLHPFLHPSSPAQEKITQDLLEPLQKLTSKQIQAGVDSAKDHFSWYEPSDKPSPPPNPKRKGDPSSSLSGKRFKGGPKDAEDVDFDIRFDNFVSFDDSMDELKTPNESLHSPSPQKTIPIDQLQDLIRIMDPAKA
ncbi:hypothetical protein Moror_17253 [Moniliophthora roreri MCA 2997]|uniref:Uncharacterized protein n=1 Tax=Moniliophthora roreri (strain MCA 2997) TaxID=1381753 RepID=V2Z1J4_MONRO|nr:hypothetical protein Moror_17253 [Moniliophthora roreri MCA 2997]